MATNNSVFKKVTKIRPLFQKPAKPEAPLHASDVNLGYYTSREYFSSVCANCGTPNQGGYTCTVCERSVHHDERDYYRSQARQQKNPKFNEMQGITSTIANRTYWYEERGAE